MSKWRKCIEGGCQTPAVAKGRCPTHYKRYRELIKSQQSAAARALKEANGKLCLSR